MQWLFSRCTSLNVGHTYFSPGKHAKKTPPTEVTKVYHILFRLSILYRKKYYILFYTLRRNTETEGNTADFFVADKFFCDVINGNPYG